MKEFFAGLRVRLRRIFRRTPPQAEIGWMRLSSRRPRDVVTWSERDLVVVYRADTDEMFMAHAWGLRAVVEPESRHYYWRPQRASDAVRCPSLEYATRRQTVLG